MTESYLFTYGLLRKDADHEMSELLNRHASFQTKATYQGKLYLIDYYPGVVPSEAAEDQVIGDVYKLDDLSILKRLDDFEGVGAAYEEPNEYLRTMQEVRDPFNQPLTAWIYLYNWPVQSKRRIFSGDFLLGDLTAL